MPNAPLVEWYHECSVVSGGRGRHGNGEAGPYCGAVLYYDTRMYTMYTFIFVTNLFCFGLHINFGGRTVWEESDGWWINP